jgi:glycine/D-amino acid oxidase-like deaminating enzyme
MGQPVCDDEFDWAIVGGGLFATAIAHALARRKGNERIIWCKGDKRRSTASSDISKIVRTRYPLPGYTLWAKEALIKWKSDETFKKFFHDCGGIRVEGLESSDERMQEMVWSDHKPDLKPDETLRLDESIGSVDFKSALDAAADEASKLGVEIREEDVTKLLVQDGTRVEVSTGEIVWAKKIIVATGPWTPGLLENSGVIFPDNFFKVVAVPVATMRLEDEESEERIKDEERPIIMTNNGASKSARPLIN